MSVRPLVVPRSQPAHARPTPPRLSQVLSAGLQRKLSLTCTPCNRVRQPLRPVAKCEPCGVTRQSFSFLLPGVTLPPGQAEPVFDEKDYTCQICMVSLNYPSEGFVAADGEIYAMQTAMDDYQAPTPTAAEQERYDNLAILAADKIRKSNPKRTEVELLIPGCGHQFHRLCLQKQVMGRQQLNDKCGICRTQIDPTILASLRGEPSPSESSRGLVRGRSDEAPAENLYVYRNDAGQFGGRVLVRIETVDGDVQFYEGPEERHVRTRSADGEVVIYDGPEGQERVVRVEYSGSDDGQIDGYTRYYEGPAGEERKVRSELPDGEIHFFEGPGDEERVVRVEFASGDVAHYEGPTDEERQVRRDFPSGFTTYYEGPAEEERSVRSEWPGGETHFYEGPKGEERVVRVEFAGGEIQYFEGALGEEHIVRRVVDGVEYMYTGPKGEEELVV